MSNPIITPEPIKAKKPRRKLSLLVAVALAVSALFVGVGIGAGSASAGRSAAPVTAGQPLVKASEPQPDVTAVPAPPADVDKTCQSVAIELQSILQTTVNDALLPYSDIAISLIDMVQYGADVDEINRLTSVMDGVSSTVSTQSARIDAVQAQYDKCVTP